MSQIQKCDRETAYIDIHTGRVEIQGKQFQLVPIEEESEIAPTDYEQENDRINQSGWSVLQVFGVLGMATIVGMLAQSLFATPLPTMPQTVIVAPAPDEHRTCLFSIGGC